MSSWQILSDSGNNFRWELSAQRLEVKSECEQNGSLSRSDSTNSVARLPSMADLLLCSRFMQNSEDAGAGASMFRTGLGKSVSVKQSSIDKALSLLSDDKAPDIGKNAGVPLSFKCIKSSGGPIPWTLVGVSRKYPVLYKERLSDGASIVRTERIEMKIRQLYEQRRTAIIDGIVSEFQRGTKSNIYNESDSEEGAKLFKILETAAEPELLMAEMSPEQLTSFASYQAKIEAIRQSDMEKSIERALADAGLSGRDVTPFMRVRVVGLTSKSSQRKTHGKEGLITIWNPSEKQQLELVEGQAYAIGGLVPINCDADILYLQTKGSTTKWQSLSPQSMKCFEPFYKPRKSVLLSNLGEVPLSSEFDVVAIIVHVGEVFATAQQKKQWIFVVDGFVSESHSEGISNSLLAISFCSQYADDDSFVPMNSNLTGSTAGFCNLIKRPKDQINHLWVAEATENTSYFLNFDSTDCSHMKNAAVFAKRWAENSTSIIKNLREKILFMIDDHKD